MSQFLQVRSPGAGPLLGSHQAQLQAWAGLRSHLSLRSLAKLIQVIDRTWFLVV